MGNSLSDFLKSFGEDDIVVSEPEQKSISTSSIIEENLDSLKESNITVENSEQKDDKLINNKERLDLKDAKVKIDSKPKINLKLNLSRKITDEKTVETSQNVEKVQEKVSIAEIPSQNQLDEQRINYLFFKSETKEVFKEKWIEIYKKALSSDKKTITNSKIRNGRFRINDEGALEILANFDTQGKNCDNLLNTNWVI